MKKYMYKGVTGCIIELNNNKVEGLTAIDTCGDRGFFALADLDNRGITDDDTCGAYDDCYTCYEFGEIIIGEIVNVENEQQLVEDFVGKEYYEHDYAARMLTVDTDDHYDWLSNYSDVKERVERGEYESLDELRRAWRDIYSWFNTSELECSADALLDRMVKELREEWRDADREDIDDNTYRILFE